ncbi:MAG TPA: magnesium transporter [Candidatus Nanoarchaeia archaeon]|nr:magnesium transporter [Candidatus Nanoarchaeia archaeon]
MRKIILKIFTESIKILIIASILSAVGGLSFEFAKEKIIFFLPFLILIPALNDMIGDFGSIIASRVTTMLYLGKMNEKEWWKNNELGNLFFLIITTALVSSFYLSVFSVLIAYAKGFSFDPSLLIRIIAISLIATILLVSVIFWMTTAVGVSIYKRKEDPANFLIPISTSIADLGTMLIISGVVYWLF